MKKQSYLLLAGLLMTTALTTLPVSGRVPVENTHQEIEQIRKEEWARAKKETAKVAHSAKETAEEKARELKKKTQEKWEDIKEDASEVGGKVKKKAKKITT